MSAPANPPFAPYPPFPPYPPYPPYLPTVIVGSAGGVAVGGGAVAPAAGAGPVAGQPGGAGPGTQPGTRPSFTGESAQNPLSVYFNKDEWALRDETDEGAGFDQLARIREFAANAQQVAATSIAVDGFVSPEGDPQMNAALAQKRAERIRQELAGLIPTATVTVRTTQVLSGDPGEWPTLRRADVYVLA